MRNLFYTFLAATLFCVISEFIPKSYSDTTHSGLPGTINISTGVPDRTRNLGDKLNENFKMVSSTINTLNIRINNLDTSTGTVNARFTLTASSDIIDGEIRGSDLAGGIILSSHIVQGTIDGTDIATATVLNVTSGTFRGTATSTSGFLGDHSSITLNGQVYGWPSADGTSGQVLETNGSKVLSWATDDTANITTVRTYRVVIGTTSTFNADIVGTTDQAFSAAVSTLGGTTNGKGTIFVQGAGTVYLFSNTVEIPKNIEVVFEASATAKSTGGTKLFDLKGKLVNPTFDLAGQATAGWITFSSGSMILGGKTKVIMLNTGGTPITYQVLNASNVVIDGHEVTFIGFTGDNSNSSIFLDIENSTKVIVQRCKLPSQNNLGHAGDQLLRIRGGYDILITDNDLEWKRRVLGMSNQSGQYAFRNVRLTNNRITVPASGVATDGMIYIDCNGNIAYSSSVVISGNYVHFVDSVTAADPFIFIDTGAGAESLVYAPIITNNIVTANFHTQTQFLKIDTGVRKPIIRGNIVNNLATFLNDLGASGVINADNYLNGILQ